MRSGGGGEDSEFVTSSQRIRLQGSLYLGWSDLVGVKCWYNALHMSPGFKSPSHPKSVDTSFKLCWYSTGSSDSQHDNFLMQHKTKLANITFNWKRKKSHTGFTKNTTDKYLLQNLSTSAKFHNPVNNYFTSTLLPNENHLQWPTFRCCSSSSRALLRRFLRWPPRDAEPDACATACDDSSPPTSSGSSTDCCWYIVVDCFFFDFLLGTLGGSGATGSFTKPHTTNIVREMRFTNHYVALKWCYNELFYYALHKSNKTGKEQQILV